MARPMPRLPPVTMATLPERSNRDAPGMDVSSCGIAADGPPGARMASTRPARRAAACATSSACLRRDAVSSADHDRPDPLPWAVPLEGASNLRDLGGWPVADGRRVRRGLVYRSATLDGLTVADQAQVAALGIRTVCDLRGEREAAARPSRLPPSAERVALPIEPAVGASLRDLAQREESTGEDVVALLRQAYLDYASRFLPVYRRMFTLLLEPGRTALMFHCSAGKDRTGLGAALLLTALGATRQVVMDDYLATDRLWRRDHPLPPGTPKPLGDALLATHPALLEEALDTAVAAHGGVPLLLECGLGLDAARLAALRDTFLE
ncbi:tyrosine-protein phosphatase [Paracraurococcus ruber]|nr:tyrosine-protein phosphatase [Paracraurococcus ruber]